MKISQYKNLNESQLQQIDVMWNEAYPVELKDRFHSLLQDVEEFKHYLIQNHKEEVLAWAVHFRKDGEVRFSIIVREEYKGKGFGKALIQQLKSDLDEFYGWVIDHDEALKSNGENYLSPLKFYEQLGFEILNNERIDNEILQAVKIRYHREPAIH